ncbi:DUF4307 domain-containing protein [Nocardia bovistercoris]|uniref:DUF4307 domain-containing protein n=1 Tax=Nocardia bovistercoris TaxID=2785916 RepID=A0A931I9Y4_9NOCA|nr:DUF4307 domain-containing protein [Nocardia bovistercoris]MBH0776028.1 DUF4307 domain-containing protein [Nocardia bovistercoris]
MNQPAPEHTALSAAEAQARRADRYGFDSGGSGRVRRRWIPVAIGVFVLVAGLGVAYLGFQKYGPRDIEAEQLGYTVVDDSTLSVHLKVTRADPTRPAVCFVRAMDRDGAEVGRREILLTASESGTVELTTVVRSSTRPSAGNVYGCSDRVPEYLRAG